VSELGSFRSDIDWLNSDVREIKYWAKKAKLRHYERRLEFLTDMRLAMHGKEDLMKHYNSLKIEYDKLIHGEKKVHNKAWDVLRRGSKWPVK